MTRRSPPAIALIVGIVASCAARTPPPEIPVEKPPLTLAVLGFGGSDANASPAEDGCVMALLEAGFRVVDRARLVAAVPTEDDVDYGAVGRGVGADLIVEAGWKRNERRVAARLRPRMISTHSASVLAIARPARGLKLSRAWGRDVCRDLIGQLP